EVHGSAAYYFRRDSLDAHDFFADEQPKLKRDNAVFTLGGPIVKNKTFFFGSFDYTKTQQATTVDTGGAAPELDGTFPLPTKRTLASIKIDHPFDDKNHLTVGYHLDNNRQDNLAVGGIYAESYGYSRDKKAWGVNASLDTIVSARSYNEARVSFLYNNVGYVQNSSPGGQHFPSYYVGQNYFMPQSTLDRKIQVLDNFSTILNWHGEHQVKAGVSYAHWYESAVFALTSGGSIFYNSDDVNDPALYLKGYGDPTAKPKVNFWAGFLQD